MEKKIVVDSCVDFNEDVFNTNGQFERVPFKINIDDETIVDKNLDTSWLLSKMKASTSKIMTTCPSPNDFLDVYRKCRDNFVVTISSKLSASYNSALIAKDILNNDELSQNFVHVFDSKTASVGQSLVALKVKQLIEESLPTAQIIEKVNHYVSNLKTLFILESLDNLIKNGRISKMGAIISSLISIVPIMGSNVDGGIELKAKARGSKRAFGKLLDMIGEDQVDFKNTILGITYVNAKDKAEALKMEIQKMYSFKEVLIFKSGGLSTVYADDGGIVIAY